MEVQELCNEALSLMNNNRLKDGMRILEKALLIDNNDIDDLNIMGLCSYIYCNFNKAKYYFEKSSKIFKGNKTSNYIIAMYTKKFYELNYKYNKALEHIKNEEYESAIELLEEIKTIDKELIPPYELLYMLYNEIKESELALENIKIAYSLDTSNEYISRYYNEGLQNKIREYEDKITVAYRLCISIIIVILISLLLWIYL